MSINRLNGVYLTLEDAEYTSQALDLFIGYLRRNQSMPSAKLETFAGQFRKTVANVSNSRPDASSTARLGQLHRVSSDNGVHAVMSPAEAAKVLGITANGVRDLARRGTLPARMSGQRWVVDAAAVIQRAERRD